MTVSNIFSSTKGLAYFQRSAQKGNKIFKDISRVVDTLSNSPITRLVGSNVPALRPLTDNVKSGNERLKNVGKSLAKAEKKGGEIRKAIDFR